MEIKELYEDEKTKALKELLKQMYDRMTDEKEGSPEEEAMESPKEEAMEDLSPMAGKTDVEIEAGPDEEGDEEPELKKIMREFMGDKGSESPKGKTAKVMIKSVSARPMMKRMRK